MGWGLGGPVRYAHGVEDVRAAEGALMAQLPPGTLMARAAAGLAATCATLLGRVYGASVVLLVGSGDNGGDALYAGLRLARRGARVTAVVLGSRVHEQGLADFRAAGGLVTAEADALSGADLVIDGIVGIGGKGELRPDAVEVVSRIPPGALVVAVDIPSGVDPDTGEVAGAAARADVTLTFGTGKPGLLVDPGASHAGHVQLVDIGLRDLPAPAVAALQSGDIRALLPTLEAQTEKYRRGVVGVVAGSQAYTGAAVLTAGAAAAGVAGMVRFISTAHPAQVVRQRWPEVVVTVVEHGDGDGVLAAGRVQAWAVGPGIGTDAAAERLLDAVLSTDLPVLVDADGLTLLAGKGPQRLPERPAGATTLLTPHAGELARLLGVERADVEARRLEHARRAAGEFGATVLLKGSTTLVAPPDGGTVYVNPTGTPWLSTAGSGDVLTGLAGSLLAAGLAVRDAAAAAAFLHGLAGRLAAVGVPEAMTCTHLRAGHSSAAEAPCTAGDVLAALPAAFRAVAAG